MIDSPPPYRPLRGAEPPHFVDRYDEDDIFGVGTLASSLQAYSVGPADPRWHRLVYGPPAVGRTALLRALAAEVSRTLGWATVSHTCRPKQQALPAVAQKVTLALQQKWPAAGGARWASLAQHPSMAARALNAGPLQAVDSGGGVCWQSLWQLLRVCGQVCNNAGPGLLVVLDDVGLMPSGELEIVGHLARALSSESLPVAFLLSGDAHVADRLDRPGAYDGAIWPTRLAWLDNPEARQALVVPATERGVDIEEGAVQLICRAAGGAPLDLQRLAFGAWSVATGNRSVTLADAERALSITCAVGQKRAS